MRTALFLPSGLASNRLIKLKIQRTIQRKNGMEAQKRTITLNDMSGRSVELTMWGDFCNREGSQLQKMVECGAFPVLAVKARNVNDYSGKSVGTISSSQLHINPDLAEAHSLRQWFDWRKRCFYSVYIQGFYSCEAQPIC
jgi:hypothetical protein